MPHALGDIEVALVRAGERGVRATVTLPAGLTGVLEWGEQKAPLRADLMRDADLKFVRGDAFSFTPDKRVDWLLCDVIAAPERSIELLVNWLKQRWTKRFVVTIKFKGQGDYARLEQLKHALNAQCEDFRLTRLCANKNEACAFGVVR